MKQDRNNISKPSKGLHTDASPLEQPKGTYRFALNAVNETELGDLSFNSNEESNVACAQLPDGYIPIGKIYINNNSTVIFSVSSDNTISEIGIVDGECNYVTHVNGDLGFKVTHQIQGSYRLRKGCERTIYFVDGDNNKPRYFNFDKPEAFQTGGNWDTNKFELIRSYESIPIFEDIEVLDSGGQLESGGYNIAIQYLDEDLNPTEWITTSHIIKVFNDDLSEEFLDIRGSINSDTDYIDFATTDKSIRVEFNNLDDSFLFYRLAFIEASNGTGIVNAVRYTENIPTSKNFFIYTGVNFVEEGTEEEIQAFNNIIDSAGSIEQIENRLVLANTKGKKTNFCKLQKFASRIKADVITKKVLTNVISEGNAKNPTVNREAAGYMPGEIYSFGIVYVFKDGSQSPVYHIPGKSASTDDNVVFSPGDNVYPMSNDNASLNNTYIDNSTCGSEDYWGVDYEGNGLTNQPVRHHRFPLRSDLNLDLVTEEDSNNQESLFYQVNLTGSGTITLPCSQEDFDAGDCSPQVDALLFQVRVVFEVDGVETFMTVNIDPANESNPFEIDALSNFYTSNNIVITDILESQDNGTTLSVFDGNPSPKGITYNAAVVDATFTTENKIYSTEVYGIKFSGVDLPSVDETNGEEIIGYYIVRNDRDESEKTILDSAVLTQCVVNSKYTSHGLLFPEFDNDSKVSKKVFGLIHPEHKFYNKQYTEFTDIIQEGAFEVTDRKYSKSRYRDVQDGTSFDDDVHKGGGGNDDDGWSLKTITRDNITQYKRRYDLELETDDVEDIFYLDALQSRSIEDDSISAYNISGDNKVGMVHTKEEYTENLSGQMPYVYLRRDISDSYSTFRTLPYYKASNNISDNSETAVFGGDTYITPMRYVNTMFWDNRIAQRAGRTSVWNYIIGAILVVVGAVLTFFTAGASTLVIAAGVAIIGGGALFISSGIKRDALVRAYNDEYDKGLRETTLDKWVNYEYQGLPCQGYGRTNCDTPEDDEIQWLADCATDLWFESQVNTSIRHGFAVDTPTFIDAPGKIESGNEAIENAYEHFDVYKQRDVSLYPFTVLDKHVMSKLLTFNPERNDSRSYIGHPLGEFYAINPDYNRINKQKIFYHLGIEYDCCSDCQEEFPHRVHYSEQSFQEELSDNYRIFLPNNYRDIEGEKGQITNLYRLQNNLYIHTEEALWHLPQNYQERVTNDIVSFIGTGSYFETPPRKIVDDSISSAGTQHKWGAIKTKNGILFPSQIEKKWYLFNGQELKAISDYGNSNWFKENMDSLVAQQYYNSNGRPYPYLNNPSNMFGEGFVSTYDTKKERLIVTKKDFSLNPELINNTDYELCVNDGEVTIFENYDLTIQEQEALGWEYIGIENCQMKFSRTELEEVEEEREITVTVPNTADIHVFYDTSGSFGNAELAQLDAVIDDWIATFAATNPDWTGTLYKYNDGTERWVNYAQVIGSTTYAGQNLLMKDIIVISFCNESSASYHGVGLDGVIESPTVNYLNDYDAFTGSNINGNNPSLSNLYASYNSFLGIHYPVVFNTLNASKEFLAHSLAALKGVSYTSAEASALSPNPGMTTAEQNTMLTALQGANPYPDNGLENFGWVLKEDRFRDSAGNVIDSATFQEDITTLLEGQTTTETITVTVQVPTTVYQYIDGEPLEGELVNLDNSWTMSYSLKDNAWISWHSYMPNFYYYISDKFYSYVTGDNFLYKHNVVGTYQNFYKEQFPYIVEYVSLSSAIQNKIWDSLELHTEAKKYFPDLKQYVDERYTTFNKAILYNTRQCTGLLQLVNKDTQADPANYLLQQVTNSNDNTILIDRNERNWSFNDIRDIRVDYTQPIFDASLESRNTDYFTDKVLNDSTIDVNKDWTQLESFRDKYLVVRLIFDNFDDVKLIMNYSVENETSSNR